MTENVNGINKMNKINNVKQFVEDYEVDVLGIQETNTCWYKCRYKDRLQRRLKVWKEACYVGTAYNTTEKWVGKYQPGGMGLITVGRLTHRKIGQGIDEKKVGR